MQGLEVSGAVRPINGTLGVKRLTAPKSRLTLDAAALLSDSQFITELFHTVNLTRLHWLPQEHSRRFELPAGS